MADTVKSVKHGFSFKPFTFLGEVKSELSMVTWPAKDEVVKLTLVVILVSIALGFYIGGLDMIFTKMTDFLVKR